MNTLTQNPCENIALYFRVSGETKVEENRRFEIP